MHCIFLCHCALITSLTAQCAEIQFDFSQYSQNEFPAGFQSALFGQGQPGEWKIIPDESPFYVPNSIAASAPGANKKVLAQLSSDTTDERFPMLIYEGESFGDFKLTTHFKIIAGKAEEMAGIAFRIRDEKNYYYVRASALGNTFRFFKIVEGQRSQPIGPEIQIQKGVWHEMAVECKGNQIRCWLDGREPIPQLTDNSFSVGKIGFWTKSDSITYFSDTKIDYTPRETLGKVLVREMFQTYPRLVGLKIFASLKGAPEPRIIASTDAKDVGHVGSNLEKDVITRDVTYFGQGKKTVTVTLPLHDRNGEAIAAVNVIMKSFIGQTEQNAIARALPIIKLMESRIRNSTDLLE